MARIPMLGAEGTTADRIGPQTEWPLETGESAHAITIQALPENRKPQFTKGPILKSEMDPINSLVVARQNIPLAAI